MSNSNDYDLIIEPGKADKQYWRDIWTYQELFTFLAWRDFLVRYKQTVIGIAWSVIRPVLTMLVFTIIFGKLAKMPSEGIPYPILVFAAMLPWQFFASALAESSNSLIGNATMVSKIYFPRLIIPSSTIIVCLVDFAISLVILAILMIGYRFSPDWHIVFLPLFLIIAIVSSMGLGCWFAALNVKYRDFRYVVPFIVQIGLYISPVGFSSSVVPEKWRLLYYLNPMAGVIDGFRWCLLGGQTTIFWPGFLLSMILIIVILIIGIQYFRKTERSFADII